ncbi:thioredoxin-like protein [Breznakibacter xylanolyticus]|uniref:Thioredoxin-like protein n=1 Tax=Breznakibacter xylanolyticus TaxID=990 RepID=A0A2W7MQD5_9BACT|nr:(2Fe-2S) ferredoxin domain-containing protein [Breznakibacter xylanolyticus]PZX10150.1 thioredoxin-like protein [Breznakibacter xylanolyticus]
METEITICLGSSCYTRGNRETLEVIRHFIAAHQLQAKVFFHGDLCTGRCSQGPILRINDRVYEWVTPDNVVDILMSVFGSEDSMTSMGDNTVV